PASAAGTRSRSSLASSLRRWPRPSSSGPPSPRRHDRHCPPRTRSCCPRCGARSGPCGTEHPCPASHTGAGRPDPMRARRPTTILLRALLVVLGTVALALVVLALALPSYARKKTREALDGLSGAHGDFQDVQVTLVPLRYT